MMQKLYQRIELTDLITLLDLAPRNDPIKKRPFVIGINPEQLLVLQAQSKHAIRSQRQFL